jgi:hypothetical protein
MNFSSANLAQLVEQLIRNEQVAGSIPAVGSELFLSGIFNVYSSIIRNSSVLRITILGFVIETIH